MDKQSYKKVCILVIGAIFLYWGLQHYQMLGNVIGVVLDIAFPFILGGVIAFIINVPMAAIEKRLKLKKYKRAIAYCITLLLMLAVLTFCFFVIIPQLAKTVQMIAQQIPIAITAAQQQLEKISLPEVQRIIESWNIDWSQLTQKAVAFLQNSATGLINSGISVIGGLISGITSFVIGFVFSVYVLFQKEKLAGQLHQILRALMPERRANRILEIGGMTNQIFSKFISGQCIEAIILGSMFFVTMLIFQMPYALAISVLITLTALIPIVGAFIGCFIGALLIVIVSPWKALGFIILFLVLQQIEGDLIYPHVVGNSVGLPSIWVLVAVTVGGDLMGIAGMLIFIPICSVLYVLFREFIKNRLHAKAGDQTPEEGEP